MANKHRRYGNSRTGTKSFFMRKLIIILLFAALFITACKKEIAETKTATETRLANALNAPAPCTGNTWVNHQNFPPTAYQGYFPLFYNNKAYFFNSSLQRIYIYNGTSWDSVSSSIPQFGHTDYNWREFRFTLGNKGYIGAKFYNGQGKLTNYFWEYNFDVNTWMPKAKFSGPAREGVSTFSNGGKGYIVGGVSYSTSNSYYTNYKDTWEYDQLTNSWTKKADLPVALGYAGGFSIGSKGYIVNGAYWNRENDIVFRSNLYEYNTQTDAWSLKAPFPGAGRLKPSVFVISGLAYVGGGKDDFYAFSHQDYYKYNPATNSWGTIASLTATLAYYDDLMLNFSLNSQGYAIYRQQNIDDGLYKYKVFKYTPQNCNTGTSQ